MKARHLALLALGLSAGVGVLSAATVPQTGTISGVVVAAREDEAGDDQLLVATPNSADDGAVDTVQLEMPQALVDAFQSSYLPAGWEALTGDGVLSFTGPPVSDAEDLFFRIGFGGLEAPNDVGLRLLGGGTLLYEQAHGVDRFPPIDAGEPVEDLVDAPGQVSPGETVEFTIRDTRYFRDFGLGEYGKWRLGASLAYEMDGDVDSGSGGSGAAGNDGGDGSDEADGETPEPMKFSVGLSYDLEVGMRLPIRFTTAWDETVVEYGTGLAPEVVAAPEMEPMAGWILNCSPKAFAGDRVCVCGWFPEADLRNGLRIDGQPLGPASAGSQQTARVALPGELSPGRHVITGANLAGSAEVTIVQIGGDVDQERLMRGESTPLRLWVTGTEDPTTLTLTNLTPEIIDITGGVSQQITTSGGAENEWVGTVRGISVGPFNISYALDLSSCPCSEQELEVVAGELTAETVFDETFRSFRRGRELAQDGYYHDPETGTNPHDLAQDALDELAKTRKRLQDGIDAWNNGDDGGIGPETAATFERFITEYETMARTVLARPVTSTTTTTETLGGTVVEEPDGEDPRDTPPPEIYGEELDPPFITVTDGWFAPSQGVWQDDDYFADKATKQLTRLGPTAWNAELAMVANRSTLLFGTRDDGRLRMRMSGQTNYSQLVPVKFRFKLIQGGSERILWTQPAAENHIRLDGGAGELVDWAASLMAPEGLPDSESFTMQPGPYTLEMELVRENGDPTGLKITVAGNVVETSFPPVAFVPAQLSDTPTGPELVEVINDARKQATASVQALQHYFPLPRNAVTTSTQPLQDLRRLEPGVVDTLISKLPFTDTTEEVRTDRIVATMAQRFATGASLSGGGKVVVILADSDFELARRGEDVAAFAPNQKVVVLRKGNPVNTVAHELIHTIPYLWSRDQMAAQCGINYHNAADNDYGNGVEIWTFARLLQLSKHAIMGSAYSSGVWITQCTYWHLLSMLQAGIDPELYLVRGYLGRDGDESAGVLAPAYELEDVGELRTGERPADGYAIVLRNEAGEALATYPFEVSWEDTDLGIERTIVPFTWRVDQVPGTASIELVGPSGALDALEVTANAPTLDITSIAADTVVAPIDGQVRLEWTAEDADGDDLSYLVLFSPDGGETWRLEADELTEPAWDLRIIGRPLSPRVRVIATDGVRSATTEVGFTLAR